MPFLQNRVTELQNSATSSKKDEIAQSQVANKADANSPELVKFFWIRAPKAMVYNQNFSDGAKLLYLILLDYQGRNSYAFPSLETLARDTGKTIRRVQQLLKELELGEVIEVVSQPGWVNLYRVGLPSTELTSSSEVTGTICDNGLEEDFTNNATSETLSQPVEKIDQQAEQKDFTPLKEIAPLPMQYSSSELNAIKLENSVCKKLPVVSIRARTPLSLNTNITQPNNSNTNLNHSHSLSKTSNQSMSGVQLHSEISLTEKQAVIAKILHNAGVATVDAERIALNNPKQEDVEQWVEFAKTKTNPGGYLAVVLGKVDAVPPLLSKNCGPISSNNFSYNQNNVQNRRYPQGRRHSRAINGEAGAVAYMRRHDNELKEWQGCYFQDVETSNFDGDGPAITDYEVGGIIDTEYLIKPEIEQVTEVSTEETCIIPELETIQTNTTEESENTINWQLRCLIREIDKTACSYLRQAYIKDDKLVIGFVGNYMPAKSIYSWLPVITAKFTTVNSIRVV